MSTQVVALDGEIDIEVAPDLRRRLHEAVDASPGSTVTIDMAKVTFIDSTGLGLLVSALKRARQSGGSVTIANAAPNVAKVFRITGLDQVLEVSDASS